MPRPMRPVPLAMVVAITGLLAVTGCRDEQAGPRPKAHPAVATSAPRVYDGPPGPLTFQSGATWAGGALEYLGARVVPGPQGAVNVGNYFRAQKSVPSGYQFFLHVVDLDTGLQVANADHSIALPEGGWPLGKVVEDTLSLRPPVGRQLELRLGFYRGAERLQVDTPNLQDGEQRVRGPVLGQSAALPEYHAHRLHGAIRLDGVLDDQAWKQATPVVLARSLDGGPVKRRTVARLLYDDAFLYLAFDCEDDDVWGTFLKRDEPLYSQEVVEVFLDASADGRTYHEIEVSPHNVVFDAYFPSRRQGMDLSWDSGIESAVHVDGTLDDARDRDRGWSVEMKLPVARLKDLEPGKSPRGMRWRFNLYRLEHLGRRDIEGQAFSPLFVGDFHNLPRFGWLVFDD